MGTLTIGQVAERTGFSTSSLRYYEGIGLVEPVGRTAAGYRAYDEATLGRLAFIARAKQLGCTLDEIADLVGIGQGERCGPVQRRLHHLVTDKLAEARGRIEELTVFAAQLRSAAAGLDAEPVDGPCRDGCACLAAPPEPGARVPAVGAVPVACTLGAADLSGRIAEWRPVLAHVAGREATADGGVRLVLGPEAPVAELLRLVGAEQECCAFLTFTVTLSATGTVVQVEAPTDGRPVLTALFGEPG